MKYQPGDWVIFSGQLPQEYRDAFDETWRAIGRMQVVDVLPQCRLPGDNEPREALVLRVGTSGSVLVRPEWVIPWVPDLTPFIRQVLALAHEYVGAVKQFDVELRSEKPTLSLFVNYDVFRANVQARKLAPVQTSAVAHFEYVYVEFADPKGWTIRINSFVPDQTPAPVS
ncbi:hypothetical protein [Caldinitratiruptor microaerophilus]|uniref:Uncharacterized protein n=1 Tax=Caldinitratiruptor microaerophilus TaxID=671077 RepID=A0AA35CJI1_9FIRM|nr:hypothetical protein [Caldinitratiruptor microaerophilus]BDG60262.1 hypothetical protein caldi_13520 [Caldinitratiruptor microaerophilus]